MPEARWMSNVCNVHSPRCGVSSPLSLEPERAPQQQLTMRLALFFVGTGQGARHGAFSLDALHFFSPCYSGDGSACVVVGVAAARARAPSFRVRVRTSVSREPRFSRAKVFIARYCCAAPHTAARGVTPQYARRKTCPLATGLPASRGGTAATGTDDGRTGRDGGGRTDGGRVSILRSCYILGQCA